MKLERGVGWPARWGAQGSGGYGGDHKEPPQKTVGPSGKTRKNTKKTISRFGGTCLVGYIFWVCWLGIDLGVIGGVGVYGLGGGGGCRDQGGG